MLKPVLHDLAVVHDSTAGFLTATWWMGDLFDRTTYHGTASSWAGVARYLRGLADHGAKIRKLQMWQHGYFQGPVIDGRLPTDQELRDIKAAAPHLREVWFRACDVGRNPANVERLTRLLEADVVCHCVVISAGEPVTGWFAKIWPWKRKVKFWSHDRGVGLRRGQRAWWDPSDSSLPSCLVTDMVVPDRFWK